MPRPSVIDGTPNLKKGKPLFRRNIFPDGDGVISNRKEDRGLHNGILTSDIRERNRKNEGERKRERRGREKKEKERDA